MTGRPGSSLWTFPNLTRDSRPRPLTDASEMEAPMAATERAEEDLASRDQEETKGSRGAKEAGDKAGVRTFRSLTLWMRTDKEDRAETSESLLVS